MGKNFAVLDIFNFDISKQIVEGGLYKYPMKNISRTAKFFPTFD
jgi:hypothetical protein